MPNPVTGYRTTYKDAKGHVGKINFYVSADTAQRAWGYGPNATLPLVDALTNAVRASTSGGFGEVGVPGTYGTQAQYGSCEDKALLTFVANGGTIVRFQIPAPKVSIFLADEVTVDVANTDVAAFAAHVTGTGPNGEQICTKDSRAIPVFIGGTLIRRRQQRKLNIFIKDPTETGPAE